MSDAPTADSVELQREVDNLRAERDRLQRELQAADKSAMTPGRIRGVAVFVLLVLACVSFTGAIVGVWAKRSFLNNEVFADRAAPLGADPAVQAALSVWLTDQLMEFVDPEALFVEVLPERGQILAAPLSGALRNFVQGQVDDFLASDTFANLWAEAVTRAHNRAIEVVEGDSEVLSTDGEEIVVNLVPVINAALAKVGEASPELLGRTVTLPTLTVDDIPEAAQAKLSEALGVPVDEDFGVVRIDDGGQLAAAQDGVRLFGAIVWLLVALTVVLIPLALWLSRRRRRTLLQLVFGLAFGLVLVRRLGLRIEGDAVDRIADPTRRAAASSIAQSFVDPLLDFTVLALWVLAAIAVVALLTGPYRWAVALRRGAVRVGSTAVRTASTAGERATDEDTIAWLRANTSALQVGGVVVAFLLMLVFDLSWGGLGLLILLLAAFEAGVWWLGQSVTTAKP